MRAWWLLSSQAIITHILAQLPCHVLALPSWEADFFNRSHTWKWPSAGLQHLSIQDRFWNLKFQA